MTKRLISVFLVLALCLTFLPTAVLAEGDGEKLLWQDTDTIYYGTAEQMNKEQGTELTSPAPGFYTLSAGSYKLATDISIGGNLSISGSVTLDLNGKRLNDGKALASDSLVKIGSSDSLTLNDSVGGGEISLYHSDIITVSVDGTFIMNGGTVSSTGSCDSVSIGNGGIMYANGGAVTGKVSNKGTITRSENAIGETTFGGEVQNENTISGGVFYGTVTNTIGSAIISTSGSVVNHGVFVFESGKNGTADVNGEYLKNTLKLSGTGYVQVGSDSDISYYSHSGTELKKPLNVDAKGDLTITDSITLTNAIIPGTLTVPNDDVIITIDGTVIVNNIEAPELFQKTITIQGQNNGTDGLYGSGMINFRDGGLTIDNLYVEYSRIEGEGTSKPLLLHDADVVLNAGLSYMDNSVATGGSQGEGNYGLTLVNSNLTVRGGYYILNGYLYSGDSLWAGKISMDDWSILTLDGAYITNYGNITDGLGGLSDFLPEGYSISSKGEFNEKDGYYIGGYTIKDPNGKVAMNVTLRAQTKTIELGYTTKVVKGGNVIPPEKTFTLEVWDEAHRDDKNGLTDVTASGSVQTNGVGDYVAANGLTLTGIKPALDALFWDDVFNYSSGIYVCQKQDGATYWDIDDTVYYITKEEIPKEEVPEKEIPEEIPEEIPVEEVIPLSLADGLGTTYYIYEAEEAEGYYNPPMGSNIKVVEQMTFTNTYTNNGQTSGSSTSGDGGYTYYTINATANDGGSISPSGIVSVREGNNKTFTITPADGYKVNDVLVDGKSVGAVTTYTFQNVKANHTIKAIFADKTSNIPFGLNSTDHMVYVHGYDDGTVKPEANITRAETAVMLYRLLTPERRAEIETDEHSFTDMTAADWYSHQVATMANGGYIAGYADGRFGGNDAITRSQFVVMLTRFLGVRDVDCDFTDVPANHWAYHYIATAVDAGWIGGYSDGTFRPDQPITRAQVMAIINRALNRGVDASSELLNFRSFPDNPATAWYYYEVIEATNGHNYIGSRPSEDWTALR